MWSGPNSRALAGPQCGAQAVGSFYRFVAPKMFVSMLPSWLWPFLQSARQDSVASQICLVLGKRVWNNSAVAPLYL
jgi:hypothetical protein